MLIVNGFPKIIELGVRVVDNSKYKGIVLSEDKKSTINFNASRSEWFIEGFRCFDMDNPFPIETIEHCEWNAGQEHFVNRFIAKKWIYINSINSVVYLPSIFTIECSFYELKDIIAKEIIKNFKEYDYENEHDLGFLGMEIFNKKANGYYFVGEYLKNNDPITEQAISVNIDEEKVRQYFIPLEKFLEDKKYEP